MKKALFMLLLTISLIVSAQSPVSEVSRFRPPSVPLVTHDPYFSIWSPADRLTDVETVHWTGARNPLHSMIRVDGKTYRLMGSNPSYIEPLKQLSLRVQPTNTIYTFGNNIIKVTLTFTSPLLVKNTELLSRPVTYITWKAESADKKDHKIEFYFDCGSELTVNVPDQQVTWDMPAIKDLNSVRIGSLDQKYLNRPGDNLRIDWGYLYMSVTGFQQANVTVAERKSLFESFVKEGKATSALSYTQPRKVSEGNVSGACVWDLEATAVKSAVAWIMLAYDDIYSIKYFDDSLKAWWRRDGLSFDDMLISAAGGYGDITSKSIAFDRELVTDLTVAGGEKYARVCALAYRQCLAAHKLVADKNGNPLFFPKENFSNGCIATVDVIYPFSPFALLFSPTLTKAMLRPVMDYSASSRWKFPFAPHDLGQYPFATGQVYGGGEKDETNQMPVEETGNMLIMLAALAKTEGNADFAKQYWDVIGKWAGYLESKGFDPENQLCTDDFAGHLAHNVNLSAKAIVALRSYSYLCEMTGKKDEAESTAAKVASMARDWTKLATEGDHTLLAYDQKSTWSQKYNLVWDKLLEFNIFPPEVFSREVNFYKKMNCEFGLPLDSRERYTKNDWITWSATMTDNINDFRTIFDPVYNFADKTPDRVPLSDWYITDNARMVGFQARSVVGGYFIKMLDNKALWKKWSAEK